MRRLFLILMAGVLVYACSSGDDGERTSEGKADDQAAVAETGSAPDEEIEEPLSDYDQLVGAYIRPYFDENGTDTVRSVGVGDEFDLYVFAEFNEGFRMSAAEYKLVLPQGISVTEATQLDNAKVSLGSYAIDFSIAFACLEDTKSWLVRYTCTVDDDFEGGTVRTVRGEHNDFIGFVNCDAPRHLIHGRGGKAVLKRS